MPATKIMLIRHSERPVPDLGIRGVTEAGLEDSRELSVRGWQRAGALAVLLGSAAARSTLLGKPDAIFACAPDPKSARSLRTVEPLAAMLGLPVVHTYGHDDHAAVAERAASEADGTVLICWKQEGLPLLANALLGAESLSPQHWPRDRFDLVWVFDRQDHAGPWHFAQVPQLILPGDSPTLLA